MKGKIKIMKTRPQITDDEITGYMDFDALLRQKDIALIKQRTVRRTRNRIIGALCLVVAPLCFLIFSNSHEPEKSVASETTRIFPVPQSSDTITKTPSASERPEPAPAQKTDHLKPSAVQEKDVPRQQKSIVNEPAKAPVTPVYVQAEPVNGYPDLYEYFDKNLVYPENAVPTRVEGVVDVTFVIDTLGNASNITVENSLGKVFDDEVIRLIENMPLWRPASYNGKPVASKISLPITFTVK